MTLLAYTTVCPEEEGSVAFQFILRFRTNHHTAFVVHMHTMHDDAFHHGYYTNCLAQAIDNLKTRAEINKLEILDYGKNK